MRLAYEDWKLGTLKDEGAKIKKLLSVEIFLEKVGNTLLNSFGPEKRKIKSRGH